MNEYEAGSTPDGRIAIVGRAGRFPAASNVDQFWSMLSQSRTATKRLTDAELLSQGVQPQAACRSVLCTCCKYSARYGVFRRGLFRLFSA
ncbi:MAG: beta-ketoacyl synthase N-terminal-like domain-containing protein [Mesorhizobium sp.]